MRILGNWKEKKEETNAQGKRKRKLPSTSSNVSSSESTTDFESEAESQASVNKRLKVILKGEQFKWNLPYSMADYSSHHFSSYIPDKDIEEQLLTENLVPLNLQQVKPMDDFIRSLLPSPTVTK